MNWNWRFNLAVVWTKKLRKNTAQTKRGRIFREVFQKNRLYILLLEKYQFKIWWKNVNSALPFIILMKEREATKYLRGYQKNGSIFLMVSKELQKSDRWKKKQIKGVWCCKLNSYISFLFIKISFLKENTKKWSEKRFLDNSFVFLLIVQKPDFKSEPPVIALMSANHHLTISTNFCYNVQDFLKKKR